MTEGQESAQEKFRQIETEIQQLTDGEQMSEFHEEFKELAAAEALVAQDEQLEEELAKEKAKGQDLAEPDDKEKTPA